MALRVASVAPVQRPAEGRDRLPTLAHNVRIAIEGDNLGQIAVGDALNQVGSVHGDYIAVNVADRIPPPMPRDRPVARRGRDFPDLLGRREEIGAAREAARTAQPVEFYGPAGMGKSALLRHLAFRLPAPADGVVWLSAADRPYADLLEKLFDAFYQTPRPVKLPADDLLHYLGNVNALVLIDDVGLSRDEVTALRAALPRVTLVLAGNERRLWGAGCSIFVGGLLPDEGVQLFSRQIGRPLCPDEEAEAHRLCTALQGNPLAIIQSAALTPGERYQRLGALWPTRNQGQAATLAGLSASERRIIAALVALDGAPTQPQHLAAVAHADDVAPILQELTERGLVEQMPDHRYRLAGGVAPRLAEQDLADWRDWWIDLFARWASFQKHADPALLLRDTDTIRALIRWAAATGRHRDVIRLTRAIEPALTLDRQWCAWSEIVELARGAAVAAGLPAAEAWALHQQGTRALLEGRTDEARAALERALEMRRARGDRMGMELTGYHLARLLPPPPLPATANGSAGLVAGAGLGSSVKGMLALTGLLFLLGTGGLLGWRQQGSAAGLPTTPVPARAGEVAFQDAPTVVPMQLTAALSSSTPPTIPTTMPTSLPTATLLPTAAATATLPPPTLPPPTLPPTVFFNKPPQVLITSPATGQRFRTDELIRFTAAATDPEDGPVDGTIVWTSSLDGTLATGTDFSGKLSPGPHTLTVRAVDRLGYGNEETIMIDVDPLPDLPPTLNIELVLDGRATLAAGTTILLRAVANDQPDGDISDRVIWRLEQQGILGKGRELRYAFTEGAHKLTASVTDDGGHTTEHQTLLPVGPADLPPVIMIVQPTDRGPFAIGAPVSVVGQATDVKDGDLTGQIQWFVDGSEPVGRGGSLQLNLLPGFHTLKAVVMDSSGNERSATVTFVVPVGPDLRIALALRGNAQNQGQYFSIPVLITVTNQGDMPAQAFTIAAEYTINGSTNRMEPQSTDAPLAAGKSIEYEREVLVYGQPGQTIGLSVAADSCHDGQVALPSCAVVESNENNNSSAVIYVTLPMPLD